MQQMFERFCFILKEEDIRYVPKDLLPIVSRFSPDWRRCLNELQRVAVLGFGDIRCLDFSVGAFDELFGYLKSKDFKEMRKWVVNNIDIDATAIFRGIYDKMYDKVEPQSIPQLVLILADYQYKNAFVADHELNIVACLTEVMANVKFS